MKLSLLAMLSAALPAAFAADCSSLASLTLPETNITSAKSIPAGSFTPQTGRAIENLPAFCEVHGILKPTSASMIQFEVWLPESGWNGKLEGVGNGGLAGTISYPAMATALRNGFATASTDTGHGAREPHEWLENRDRLIDYSYRGLHLTTVAAKSIIQAYYSQAPKYSYYAGCSTGGKQGLMEAQRFPADYDGIVAGDAANYWTHQMMSEVWNGVVTGTPETNLPQAKLEILQKATLAACDALDGAADGIVSDPTRCHFDPKKIECQGADGPDCLTAAQVGAVQKIYGGPVDPRTHKKLYPGLYPGGELGWGRQGGQMVINRGKTSGVSSYDFWGYAFFHQPDWDFRTFDFDHQVQTADETLGPITNATDPNLAAFRKLGHKLIYYHGAADPLIPAQNGIDYYESVLARDHGAARYYRVFLVPGMYHCNGGPGALGFGTAQPASQMDADHDIVRAAERWVEQGTAPEKIIATRYVDHKPVLQRPLCAYPLVARYNGSGDMNDAANFHCEK